MAKTVLLAGVRADLLESVKRELHAPGTQFLAGAGVADVEDQMSGPEGFPPFVRAVLAGLGGYKPRESPSAVLRAGRQGSGAA